MDSQAAGMPTKIDPVDGVIRAYDPNTNTFGSYNPNGTTKTFYKPKRGQAYWNDQPGDEPCEP
jgi:pyocin large subunit-like protein